MRYIYVGVCEREEERERARERDNVCAAPSHGWLYLRAAERELTRLSSSARCGCKWEELYWRIRRLIKFVIVTSHTRLVYWTNPLLLTSLYILPDLKTYEYLYENDHVYTLNCKLSGPPVCIGERRTTPARAALNFSYPHKMRNIVL